MTEFALGAAATVGPATEVGPRRRRAVDAVLPALLGAYGLALLPTIEQPDAIAWGPVLLAWVLAATAAVGLRAPRPGTLGAAQLVLLLPAGAVFTVATAGDAGTTGGGWVWLLLIAASGPLLLPSTRGTVVAVGATAAVFVATSFTRSPSVEIFTCLAATAVTAALATVLARSQRIDQAREAARSSRERRLLTSLRQSGDVILTADRDGRIAFVTPSVDRVLGVSPELLLDRRVAGVVHHADLDRWDDHLRRVQAGPGEEDTTEVRMRRADGSLRWIEVRTVNRLDDTEAPGLVSSLRDVTDRHEATEALRRSEDEFRTLAQASPLGIFRLDAAGRVQYGNDRLLHMLGFDNADDLPAWPSAVHPDDVARVVGAMTRHERSPVGGRFRLQLAERTLWVEVHTAPIVSADGTLRGRVGTMADISEEMERFQHVERLSAIIEATTDMVAVTAPDGRPVYVNEALRVRLQAVARGADDRAAGAERADDALSLLTPSSRRRFDDEAIRAVQRGDVWSGELTIRSGPHDGDTTEVPVSMVCLGERDAHGNLLHVVTISRDVSQERELQRRLAHQAHHDPLTGLPNRALLLDRLKQGMARADRTSAPLAVLFCDLDNFKVVNDSLGHDVGDQLLMAVAERLAAVVRPGDTVARFGGDEFVILCEQLPDHRAATTIGERVLATLTAPIMAGGAEHVVQTSVGIAHYRRSHDRPEALVRDADAAMYQAKARGRNRCEVFDDAMRERALQRLEVESRLRRAVERHELRLHYQPVIDLDEGRLVGFEALLRWEHPERGLLGPGEFISVAEDTGLIVDIGAWALDHACHQLQQWRTTYPRHRDLSVAVNLSGQQILRSDVVRAVAGSLETSGLPPEALSLEITETVLMTDAEDAVDLLHRLKHLGVRLAVDDFGTGYSSLAYLRRFPVDILKVDQRFVDGLGRDREDTEVVRLVLTLADSLNLATVAEGVETETQLHALRELGCHRAQGFRIARPLPDATVEAMLARSDGFGLEVPLGRT